MKDIRGAAKAERQFSRGRENLSIRAELFCDDGATALGILCGHPRQSWRYAGS